MIVSDLFIYLENSRIALSNRTGIKGFWFREMGVEIFLRMGKVTDL